MRKTTTQVTCDGCGKVTTCERYDRPGDPWITVDVSGGWISPFGDAVKTKLEACSPACGAAVLDKAAARLRRAAERFPTGTL